MRGVDLGPQAGRGFSRGQLRRDILKEGIELQEMLMAEVSQRLGEDRSREGMGARGVGNQRKISEIEIIF